MAESSVHCNFTCDTSELDRVASSLERIAAAHAQLAAQGLDVPLPAIAVTLGLSAALARPQPLTRRALLHWWRR